jgi:hypothetical protein
VFAHVETGTHTFPSTDWISPQSVELMICPEVVQEPVDIYIQEVVEGSVLVGQPSTVQELDLAHVEGISQNAMLVRGLRDGVSNSREGEDGGEDGGTQGHLSHHRWQRQPRHGERQTGHWQE